MSGDDSEREIRKTVIELEHDDLLRKRDAFFLAKITIPFAVPAALIQFKALEGIYGLVASGIVAFAIYFGIESFEDGVDAQLQEKREQLLKLIPKKAEPEKLVDKEKEYRKIELLTGYYHATLAVQGTLITAPFVGLWIALVTLFFQHNIDLLTYYAGIAFTAIFLIVFLWFFLVRAYRPKMEEVSDYLERVSKGEELPTLKELIARKRKNVIEQVSKPPSTEQPEKPPSE